MADNNDSTLKCTSCLVDFPWNFRTEHYRSEWHRYNVKRKCAGLQPIAQQLFESKMNTLVHKRLADQANQNYRYTKKNYQFDDPKSHDLMRKPISRPIPANVSTMPSGKLPPPRRVLPTNFLKYHCKLCKKNFKTRQQCEAHLHTRKHASVFYDYQELLFQMSQAAADAPQLSAQPPEPEVEQAVPQVQDEPQNQDQNQSQSQQQEQSQSQPQPQLQPQPQSQSQSQPQPQPQSAQEESQSQVQDQEMVSATNETQQRSSTNVVRKVGEESASDIDSVISAGPRNQGRNSSRAKIQRRQVAVNTNVDNNECIEVVQMQKFVKKKGHKAVMKHQDQSSVKPRSIGMDDSDEDDEDDYEDDYEDNEDKEDDDDDDEEEEEEDAELLDETRCLFCSQCDFPTFTKNFEHMQKAHGFFIPLEKKLVSLEGLFEDVYEVVGEENQCTWCWHKFKSLRAVQAHMRHSGHCKLNLDRGPSVYSIKVTDDIDEKEKMDMIEQGDSIFVRHYKWGKYNDDADMVTIDEDKDYQIMPFDESKNSGVVDMNGMNELVRKDGTVIGHRDYALLYKQKTREPLFYKSNEQIIAEINNPNKRFRLEEMIANEKRQKQQRVESIKQMKVFKKHKEDALIRLNMRSHKFHIDHFVNQNQMSY